MMCLYSFEILLPNLTVYVGRKKEKNHHQKKDSPSLA